MTKTSGEGTQEAVAQETDKPTLGKKNETKPRHSPSRKSKGKTDAVGNDEGFYTASSSAAASSSSAASEAAYAYKTIKVEELTDGVIDALGQGVEIIVNASAPLASKMTTSVKGTFSADILTKTGAVFSGVVTGFGAFCDRVCGKPQKPKQGADKGFLDEAGA